MKVRIFLLVLLLTLNVANAGEWYPGLIHLHTNCSDGANDPHSLALLIQKTLNGLRADGKCFMFVTDHFLWIERPNSLITYRMYPGLIKQESVAGKFLALVGVELETLWNPETGKVASAHTLAIGELPDDYYEKLLPFYDRKSWKATNYNDFAHPIELSLSEQFGRQDDIATAIKAMGMMAIAAHPSMLTLGTKGKTRSDNRYNMRINHDTPDLGGVEMFNVTNKNQYAEAFDFFRDRVAKKQKLIATSGPDIHGGIATAANFIVGDPLTRVTWVYAESFDEQGIIKAISDGATYAANEGARLFELTPAPGTETTCNDTPTVAWKMFAPGNAVLHFEIYRNGRLAEKFMVEGQKSGSGSRYDMWWRDYEAPEGVNSYVVKVGDILVTSPIYIKRVGAGATTVEKSSYGDRFEQLWAIKVPRIGDLAVSREGNFFISCADSFVRKVSPEGQILKKWQEDDAYGYEPSTIDIDSSGNIYTFWGTKSDVSKTDQEGKSLAKLELGKEDYSFNWFPTPTFSLAPSGLLYWFNGTNVFQVFSTDGRKVRQIDFGRAVATVGAVSGQRSELAPTMVGLNLIGPVVDKAGNIFVIAREMVNTFYDAYFVIKFNPNGGVVSRWGRGGSSSGEGWTPISLELDSSGNLFVADKENHTVELYSNQGKLLANWDLAKSVEEEFGMFGASGPHCLTVDDQDKVYITVELSNNDQAVLGLK